MLFCVLIHLNFPHSIPCSCPIPLWLGNISVPFISLNAVPLPPPPKILAHRAKVRPSIEPRLSLSLFSVALSLSPSLAPRVCLTAVLSHCILCLKIYSVMLQTCMCTLPPASHPVSDTSRPCLRRPPVLCLPYPPSETFQIALCLPHPAPCQKVFTLWWGQFIYINGIYVREEGDIGLFITLFIDVFLFVGLESFGNFMEFDWLFH